MQKYYFIKSILLAAVAAGLALAASSVPQVGTEAPVFTLPSQDGTPVSLKDLRGKWVVLYFYPRDETRECTIEAHNFERDLKAYEARNAMVVGVSVDSAGSHKEFCAKQGLTFKLLADDQKRVTPMYGSLGSFLGFKVGDRNTFLIDPRGRIAKVWTGVRVSQHSADVLAALDSLSAGQRR